MLQGTKGPGRGWMTWVIQLNDYGDNVPSHKWVAAVLTLGGTKSLKCSQL